MIVIEHQVVKVLKDDLARLVVKDLIARGEPWPTVYQLLLTKHGAELHWDIAKEVATPEAV